MYPPHFVLNNRMTSYGLDKAIENTQNNHILGIFFIFKISFCFSLFAQNQNYNEDLTRLKICIERAIAILCVCALF